MEAMVANIYQAVSASVHYSSERPDIIKEDEYSR